MEMMMQKMESDQRYADAENQRSAERWKMAANMPTQLYGTYAGVKERERLEQQRAAEEARENRMLELKEAELLASLGATKIDQRHAVQKEVQDVVGLYDDPKNQQEWRRSQELLQEPWQQGDPFATTGEPGSIGAMMRLGDGGVQAITPPLDPSRMSEEDLSFFIRDTERRKLPLNPRPEEETKLPEVDRQSTNVWAIRPGVDTTEMTPEQKEEALQPLILNTTITTDPETGVRSVETDFQEIPGGGFALHAAQTERRPSGTWFINPKTNDSVWVESGTNPPAGYYNQRDRAAEMTAETAEKMLERLESRGDVGTNLTNQLATANMLKGQGAPEPRSVASTIYGRLTSMNKDVLERQFEFGVGQTVNEAISSILGWNPSYVSSIAGAEVAQVALLQAITDERGRPSEAERTRIQSQITALNPKFLDSAGTYKVKLDELRNMLVDWVQGSIRRMDSTDPEQMREDLKAIMYSREQANIYLNTLGMELVDDQIIENFKEQIRELRGSGTFDEDLDKFINSFQDP
tara:strand:- start:339 stop:1904 length:1566 start_codon:yes stop_codon:yes gene_type:complete